jgi:rod shape-determining protein MreC
VDQAPPPFFKRGPAPLVRLFFFASLSLALLVIDARFRYAEGLRSWLALAAYPLQRLATAPIDLLSAAGEYVSTQAHLVQESDRLRAQALANAENAQRYAAAEAELAELRRLIASAERLPVQAIAATIIYTARDPYAHKIFIDHGAAQGVRPGSPVADESGVIGQVTRVHPLLSEVTLLTNPDQAIPVEVVRNGLRAIAFGGGTSGLLELRYVGANVEIQDGDQLVTSGIDGTYPPGLAVATVVAIERDAEHSFARVRCRPTAGVERGRYVLVLGSEARLPPRPEEAQPAKGRVDKSRRTRPKEKEPREKAPERPDG